MAINYDDLIKKGAVKNLADIAHLKGVSRARVTQIMNLLFLALDIQEEILLLPRLEEGRDKITERNLRHIVAELDWKKQRRLWKKLKFGQDR